MSANNRIHRRPFEAEEFLETVRKFPFLYDKNEAEFKNTRFKETHWNRIGALYGMTGEACCHKFKNMKDRYTKLVTAIEKSSTSGDPTKAYKYIRWKLFPTIHDLLSRTPFCKNLTVDLKSLLINAKTTSPLSSTQDNDDTSSNKEDLVLKCEPNDDEYDDSNDVHNSGKHIIITTEPTQLFHDDEITVEEEDDGPPRFVISGTNSCDEKFTFTGETSMSAMSKSSASQHQPQPPRKRMRGPDNISQALGWATQIIEAVESRRQGQQTKIDSEEEEIVHFTSLMKHRLLKFDRKKRLTVMHHIEAMLYKEEMDTL